MDNARIRSLFDKKIDRRIEEVIKVDQTDEEIIRDEIDEYVLTDNLHGVDIDPRCAQIAQLALWMRAQKASDIHVEVIDLLANRVEAELGVAFFVACYSALRKAPVSPALLILGDMSVQGNIKPLRSLTEPLQVAKDNGAKRALIPIENKRNFLDVSADIMEHVDPVFFGDPKTAAMKVLGLT